MYKADRIEIAIWDKITGEFPISRKNQVVEKKIRAY